MNHLASASNQADQVRQGVVAVVVMREQWLVIRRSQTVRAPGKICFPGGGVERGETLEQALIREFHEELGAAIEPLGLLWRSHTPSGVELIWWHAKLLAPPATLVPNDEEVAEVKWLTVEELSTLPDLLPTNHKFLAAWRSGRFQIPGAEPDAREGGEGGRRPGFD